MGHFGDVVPSQSLGFVHFGKLIMLTDYGSGKSGHHDCTVMLVVARRLDAINGSLTNLSLIHI